MQASSPGGPPASHDHPLPWLRQSPSHPGVQSRVLKVRVRLIYKVRMQLRSQSKLHTGAPAQTEGTFKIQAVYGEREEPLRSCTPTSPRPQAQATRGSSITCELKPGVRSAPWSRRKGSQPLGRAPRRMARCLRHGEPPIPIPFLLRSIH